MSAFEYHGSEIVGSVAGDAGSGSTLAPEPTANSAIDASNVEKILVDSQELIFIGNFSRDHDDLLISTETGTFLFTGYFANPLEPDLIAPNGARVDFKTASALAGPAAPGQYAQTAAAGGELLQIGEVLKLDGTATAKRTDGVQQDLNVGDPVYQGDVLETGSNTTLGVSFLDDTVFSMSANAKMVLDELVYDPAEAEKSSMTFNLVEGTFVFAAGKIAPSGSMNIETPIATMGIRGTTPKVSVSTEFGTGEFAILPDPGTGEIGSYVLINRDTGQIIGRVNSTESKWVVTSLSDSAVEISKSTADLLDDRQAIDDIETVFSIFIGERSSLEGTATFQQVAVNSISALSNQADDAIVVTNTSTGGRQVGIVDNPNVDDPPVAVDDEFDTGEDTLITGRNVIDNPDPNTDFDPEGFTVNVQSVNGNTLDFSGGSVSILLPSGALLLIAQNGDFTYDPNDAYEFLGLNDQDVDSFTYTIVDAGGFTDTATVEITHTGQNDQPEITQIATTVHSGAFTEDTDTGGTATRTALGSITFTDKDASDSHTASAGTPTVTWNQAGGSQASLPEIGSLSVPLTEDAPDNNPVLTFDANGNLLSRPAPIDGAVNWQYSVTESDIDFLGAGETLVIVYPVTITDNSGAGTGSGTNEAESVTQDVTITLTGTNDVMVVGATDLAGAVTEDVAVTAGDLTDTGTLAFADVDLTDVHNASAAFDSTTHGGGQLGTLTASVTTDTTGTGTGGIITWDFAVANADVQFLGAGDTVTETYTITFTDNEGDTQTRDVDVTLTGTNDVMVVGATDLAGAVTEDVAVTAGDLTDTGTLAFADVDLTDVHNASAAFDSTTHGGGQLGALTASVTTDTTGTGTGGIITWDFAVANADVQFLGAGDTVTETYTITFTDNEGDTQTRDVDVTLTGTNDVMVVGATDLAGAVTEDVAVTAGDLTDTGTLAFADVDLTDVHNASAAFDSTTHGGGQLGALTASVTTDTTGTGTGGIITWDFAVANADVQFLGAGDTVTETYTITFTDNEGDTQTRDVDVTLTGTNDVMVVGATDLAGAVTEDVAVTAGDLTDTGTLAFADVDLTDVHNASAAFDSTTHGGGQLGTLTASVTTDTTGTGTGGIITWDFAVANADVQFLGAGDTVTETYTITFTDNEGDTQTRDVDVTITGINDVMVVGATDLAGAVTEDVAVTAGDLTDTGTLAFADVDLTDVHNASAAFDSTTHGGGQLGALTASVTTDTTGTGTGGIITWDFAVANADVQFLGAGDTVTETYTITFTDNEGDTQTRDVDVTLTGTNDVMVVGATDLAGAVTEDVAVTAGDLTDTGTLAFADVDLTDVHNASAAFDSTTHGGGQLGTLTASVTTDTTGTGTGGIITWDFAVANADVQFLGAGDTVTETYTITFTDNEGDTQTRDVDVTITGTNDVMVVGATDLAGAVTEDVAVTAGDLTDTGTLAFADVDLTDVHNASAAFDSTTHGGGQLGTLTASVTTDTTGTGAGGIITWDFAVANADVQFLGAGDTVTETYTITFTDNEGDTQTRDVDVTLTGTNDVMVVGATDLAGAVTEDVAVTAGDLTDTGTLAFADVDLTDVHNASAAFDSTTHGGGQLGALTASVTTDTTGTGTGGIITWDFAVANADVQFLGAGDTVTETYTITFTDNEGDTQTRDVEVTLTGVNDTPVLTVDTTGSLAEDATNPDLSATGSLSFSDLDTNDNHTVSVQLNGAPVWSGGSLSTMQVAALTSGTFDVSTPGQWDYTISNADVQFLAAGETIDVMFDVTVTDDSGATATNSDTETVAITISGVNDPPNADDDAGTTDEDTTLTVNATNGLLANDDDVDNGAVLSVTKIDGTAYTPGTEITLTSGAKLTVNADGSYEYTPAENDNGSDSFNYTISDGTLEDTATATITINPVNDAPVLSLPTGGSPGPIGSITQLAVAFGNVNDSGKHHTIALSNGGTATVSPNLTGSANLVITDASGTVVYNANATNVVRTTQTSPGEVAQLSNGNIIVTWSEGRHTVYGRIFDDQGNPVSGDLQLSDVGSFVDAVLTVNELSNGGFAITYKSWNGSQYDVRIRTFDANGTPDGPSVDTGSNNVAGYQSSTVLQNGNLAIVYTDDDDGNGFRQNALLIVQTDGTVIADVQLEAEPAINPNSQGRNGITTLNDGKIVAVVAALDVNGEMAVFAHIFNPDGTQVGSPIEVIVWSGDDFDAQRKPEVTALDDGGFAVVFANERGTQTDTNGNSFIEGTYVQQFDASGNPVGAPVFVGTYTHPQISTTSDGNILVSVYGGFSVTENVGIQEIAPQNAPLVVDEDNNLAISGVSVSDVDSASDNVELTITVTNGTLNATGTAISSGATTATLVLLGTVSEINSALATLVYSPDQNYNGGDTIQFNLSDLGNNGSGGIKTTSGSLNINVDPVNDPASIAGDNTGSVTEDGTLTATGTLTVSDVDTGEAAAQTQTNIATTYGTYSVTSAGVWTYSLNNTHAAVQALPTSGSLTDSFVVTSLDGTATETVTITINGANDAPTVTALADPAAINEGNTGVTINESFVISTYFSASDIDTGETPTVNEGSIAVVATTNSDTTNAAPFAVQGTGNATAVVVETGNYDFLNAGETGEFEVTYDVVSGSDTVSESFIITINGENDAPVVSAGGTLNFQHGIGAQKIDPSLTASDVDLNDQLVGATISVQGFTNGDGDLLNFVNQNGIVGSYDNTTGILTLSGPGTIAEYQTALSSVTYNTTDQPGTAETRTIEWQLNDGDANSTTVTSTINIPALNQVLGAVAFSGTSGDDFLNGSNLADDINGLGGNDILFGSNGQDLLTGGAGSDVFVIAAGDTDTILDFDILNDYIDISGVVDPAFDPNSPGSDLTFSDFNGTLLLAIDDGLGGTEHVIFGGSTPPTTGDVINVVYDPTAEALQVTV